MSMPGGSERLLHPMNTEVTKFAVVGSRASVRWTDDRLYDVFKAPTLIHSNGVNHDVIEREVTPQVSTKPLATIVQELKGTDFADDSGYSFSDPVGKG